MSAELGYLPDRSCFPVSLAAGGDGGAMQEVFWRIPMLSGTKSAIDRKGQERRQSRASRWISYP